MVVGNICHTNFKEPLLLMFVAQGIEIGGLPFCDHMAITTLNIVDGNF